MGRVIMNGPPDCPGGRGWCVICLMMAKQRHWEATQTLAVAAANEPGDKLTVIPWPEALTEQLAPGDYRAVSGEAPMLGIIDGLCWSHVAGVAPSSGLAVADGLPPGLIRGRGR